MNKEDKTELTKEEYNKQLMKFKKIELIDYFLKKIEQERKTRDSHIEKTKKLGKEINRLNKFIKKFRVMADKFKIGKGSHIFVEYVSEVGSVRTALGWLVEETKMHIKLRVKDKKGYYHYYIKKKLINGVKEYREREY